MSRATSATPHRPAAKQGRVRIGISGWRYAGWRGRFYPKGLRQRDELAYAGRQFDTIEINGTHYSLQRPEFFARWYDETREDFVFAIKGSRFITHMKQLRDIEAPLANFFASGLLRLDEKMGPFLWQFSPSFRFDADRFDAFLKLLPRTSAAAAALARKHDQRLAGRAFTEAGKRRTLRHAVEIRHQSFLDPAFVRLLRHHNVALVFADAVDWPYAEDVTADFLYLRLHGSEELYASGYTDKALDRWGDRVEAWRRGSQPADAQLIDPSGHPRRRARDVYVYLDNDAKVHAPFDAQSLRRRVGGDAIAAELP
ncbi:MAG TPA: DUF72 domain-containing protein [Stellaceae bacterium]|jgi:uncharacterized protein YecE (DUF72 family)|nr:DUF72 domain-containing protein [Stellaceae bacterium]